MKQKRKKIFEIYECDNDFEIVSNNDNMPEKTWHKSLVRCCLEILNKGDYLSELDIRNMLFKLHEDHTEVLDFHIVEKIKEGLKLSDVIRKNLYR